MIRLTKKTIKRVSIFAGVLLATVGLWGQRDAVPGISMDFINKVQADAVGGGGSCSDGCSSCSSANGGTASDSASGSGEGADSGGADSGGADSASCADGAI